MLLPLKAIISKKLRKDGNSLIYFQYCYSSTNRVLLSTGIAIPQQYWSKRRQCISKSLPLQVGCYETLNSELSKQRKVIEALIDKAIFDDVPNLGHYVKERFRPQLKLESVTSAPIIKKINKEPDFFEQIDDFISSREKQVCPETIATFKGMKEHLLAYQEYVDTPITFSSLDYNFYEEFVSFLTYEYQLRRKLNPTYGLRTSTIGRTIKKLRIFIRDRVRRKIIPPIDLDGFKIISEDTDAIYLSSKEVSKIYHLDLSSHLHLAKDRDLFILGCLTGLRFSDYTTLHQEDLRDGLLYKKTNKLDSWVVIPMREEANIIFNRYFNTHSPKLSNTLFNKNIKLIATLAGITESITFSYKKGNKDVFMTKPKAEWVTSHTCRRSFCTNEYLAGTEVSLIMRISGHKTIKEFFKYIRITEEEAARKIQDVWLSRNDMKAFG